MIIKYIFSAFSIFLAACSTGGSDYGGSASPYPVEWEDIARSYIKNHYLDPRSVVDSHVSSPVLAGDSYGGNRDWIICIMNNGKNAYGAYTGLKITGIYVDGNRVTQAKENEKECKGRDFIKLQLY